MCMSWITIPSLPGSGKRGPSADYQDGLCWGFVDVEVSHRSKSVGINVTNPSAAQERIGSAGATMGAVALSLTNVCGAGVRFGSGCLRQVAESLERVMGFEPTTLCLGSRYSTTELHPHPAILGHGASVVKTAGSYSLVAGGGAASIVSSFTTNASATSRAMPAHRGSSTSFRPTHPGASSHSPPAFTSHSVR